MPNKQTQALLSAYEGNIASMQRLLTQYLNKLEEYSHVLPHAEEDEKWQRQFGAKETPLSVLQKLVSVQKATHEMLVKLKLYQEEQGKCKKKEVSVLKPDDWAIIELALEQHKAQHQPPKPR